MLCAQTHNFDVISRWCGVVHSVVWGTHQAVVWGNTQNGDTGYYTKWWFGVLHKMVVWGITPNRGMGVVWGSTLDGIV